MAAIVYKYKRNSVVIISTGVNYHLTYRVCSKKRKEKGRWGTNNLHAERDAILGCSKQDLWGASIYIHRQGSKIAKPCENCMNLIMGTGISHMHWSNGGE